MWSSAKERAGAVVHRLQGRAPREFDAGMARLVRPLGREPFVVDVGANVGAWSRSVARHRPDAQFLMIEAQHECEDALRETCGELAHARFALSVLDREAGLHKQLFVCHGDEHQTGTSLRRELTHHAVEPREVTTETLDGVVAANGFAGRHVDVLKLDTQGTEVEILEGAAAVLAVTDTLVLEVSTIPYNEGAPSFEEVVDWCARHDFVLRDVLDRGYVGDRMLYADLVLGRTRDRVPLGD